MDEQKQLFYISHLQLVITGAKMPKNIMKSEAIDELSEEADKILLVNNYENLKTFLSPFLECSYSFESLYDEARYYYILANCSQSLFSYRRLSWFSDELSKSVIFYRKALNAVQKIEFITEDEFYLKSCIETNLGNSLSSQGRVFCCAPLWDDAIKCTHNPVPIISKANNELFVAKSIYDTGHKEYHYFTAYQLIKLGLQHLDKLYPEQRAAYSKDSIFMNFKAWFEDGFDIDSFNYFKDYKMEFKSHKQGSYLKWCADNKLFINDLNDVTTSEVVYQDILSMPSICQKFNPTLLPHEELIYHGNFDELKNDYCYARYLVFEAKEIPDTQEHLFNKTYPHVNDQTYTITNLKASHYKSAFKTLYSLFDKIAYFIHRFFDLNDIDKDHRISFDSIFRDINDRKKWKPNIKLKDSPNCFLHALFYILKDVRDVKNSTPVSLWLDPDAKAFSDIRNAIEHRSLKIIEDFGYELTQLDISYRQESLARLESEVNSYQVQINKLDIEIDLAKDEQKNTLEKELDAKKTSLSEDMEQIQSELSEQKKLSSHSVVIKLSEFESRLMTLMKLARNSIMYLSLAIHFEEGSKSYDDREILHREVPLK